MFVPKAVLEEVSAARAMKASRRNTYDSATKNAILAFASEGHTDDEVLNKFPGLRRDAYQRFFSGRKTVLQKSNLFKSKPPVLWGHHR